MPRINDFKTSIHYKSIILIKVHLGQIILQSAQYGYPLIIKLIHMEKNQQKNIIYNFPKRKRDGEKHTRSKIANEHYLEKDGRKFSRKIDVIE
ncbi:UNVERIFIED_CONTAM: hypothetical protein NCL1_06472 [Trichonephila clavipes]